MSEQQTAFVKAEQSEVRASEARASIKKFVMSEPILAMRVMTMDIPSEEEFRQIVTAHRKKLIECGLGKEISRNDSGYSLFKDEVARLLG